MQNDLSRGRLMFNGMSFGLQDLHDGRVASIATHTNNLLQWTSETTTYSAEVSLPISHEILNSYFKRKSTNYWHVKTYIHIWSGHGMCLVLHQHRLCPESNTLLFHKFNKAVIDSSFIPGAATWQTWQNIMSALILPHWYHYTKTASFTKPETHNVLYCWRGTEPKPMAICNMYGKFWWNLDMHKIPLRPFQ